MTSSSFQILCLFLLMSSVFSIVNSRFKRLKFPRLQNSPQDSFIPKPTIITPTGGVNNVNIEKFLMMYTCKKCNGRNAQLISKLAYKEGIVISTCKTCKVSHFIADNLGKLDMAEYGNRISDYLESKGEIVQKLSISESDLENNYLVETNGVLKLQPKFGGQVKNSIFRSYLNNL